MRGDFSRYTFDPKKRYSGVWMQQGRVQIDADWNEQQEINRNRIETECRDVVGRSGAPSTDPGFEITVSNDGSGILIGKGRYYVDGILCENDDGDAKTKSISYYGQPDLKGAPNIESQFSDKKHAIVYLDVWQRGITSIDDPMIKEKALGGADTTIRTKTVWQVKVLPLAPDAGDCSRSHLSERKVLMNARTREPKPSENPCILKASGGYHRLENQLYRVEIYKSGNLKSARFKWAADNGCLEIPVEKISGSTVTVPITSIGLLDSFKTGTFVEVADDYSELAPSMLTRPLTKVIRDPANQENQINLEQAIELDPKPVDDNEIIGRHFRLRRWDGENGLEAPKINEWIPLGNEGIEVEFSTDGNQWDEFHAGDFWLVPARVATRELEWPPYEIPNKNPEPQPPLGITHHYATLAEIKITPNSRKLERIKDCRIVFPSLAKLDARCRSRESGCMITPSPPKPGDRWEAELDKIGDANDVRICFQVGDYPTKKTVIFKNKGHITISGAGPGTRIFANSAESVFRFESCTSVTVKNLRAESLVSGFDDVSGMNHLNGTLTFCGCNKVSVEHVALRCASDAERTAACIAVRDTAFDDSAVPVSAEMVRIHNCDLEVGHQQSGIILINVKRCQVTGNLISAASAPGDKTVETLLQNPRYRSSVRGLMIHDAKLIGQAATKAAAKANKVAKPNEIKKIDLVTLSISNRSITFNTDPALAAVWKSWFELDSPLGVQSSKDLLFHMIRIADKVLLNQGSIKKKNIPFEGFKTWYDDLKAADGASARQGIVVGGIFADEVTIKDNSINDIHQGIHIGFGQGVAIARDQSKGGIIRISGNNIRVLLSPTSREREGIFVGSFSSLVIENNYIEIKKFKITERLLTDGIKVRANLGKMAIVRGNHIVEASTPIRFIKPINIDGKPLYIIEENWPDVQFVDHA